MLLRLLATTSMGHIRHLIIILLVVTGEAPSTMGNIMLSSIITHLMKPVVTPSNASAVNLHHRPRQMRT